MVGANPDRLPSPPSSEVVVRISLGLVLPLLAVPCVWIAVDVSASTSSRAGSVVATSTCESGGGARSHAVGRFTVEEGTSFVNSIGREAAQANMPQVVADKNVDNTCSKFASVGAARQMVRQIVFNPAFIDRVNVAAGRWGVMFVFAHELGHHAEGHLTSSMAAWDREFEADAFATRILRRLGAPLHSLIAAVRTFPEQDTTTHPSPEKRVKRIRETYLNEDGLVVAQAKREVELFNGRMAFEEHVREQLAQLKAGIEMVQGADPSRAPAVPDAPEVFEPFTLGQ
jgi:hypothetical protein